MIQLNREFDKEELQVTYDIEPAAIEAVVDNTKDITRSLFDEYGVEYDEETLELVGDIMLSEITEQLRGLAEEYTESNDVTEPTTHFNMMLEELRAQERAGKHNVVFAISAISHELDATSKHPVKKFINKLHQENYEEYM